MNKKQSTELEAIHGELEGLKGRVDTLMTEWQEEFDNKTEKWQEGEKGQELTNKIDALLDAGENIDAAMSSINSANNE